jgi:bacterioferritin-associated ferredoxin
MFVCLCNGVTNETVVDVVTAGATTCNQVALACGAGSECGRCRRTIRSIIGAVGPPRNDSEKESRP